MIRAIVVSILTAAATIRILWPSRRMRIVGWYNGDPSFQRPSDREPRVVPIYQRPLVPLMAVEKDGKP
jgi:hypothetical protein